MPERAARPERYSPWVYLKPAVDACLFVVAFLIAYNWRYELQWLRTVEPSFMVPIRVYVPSIAALTLILVIVHWVEGAYRPTRGRGLFEDLIIAFRSIVVGIATAIVIVFLTTPSYYSRLIFAYTGVASLVLVGISRSIEHAVQNHRHRRGLGVDRVLIVGVGESGRSVMRAIMARPELGYRIVGFLDDDPNKAHASIGPFSGLGSTEALLNVIAQEAVDEVIIALPSASHRKTLQIARAAEAAGTRVRIVPDLFQMAISSVVIENLDGIPLLGIRQPSLLDWRRVWKRLSDIVISVLTLVITAPLFLVLAIAIKLDSPGPVLYRAPRVGENGRTFSMLKLRSMYVDADARLQEVIRTTEDGDITFKRRDDPRITRVGRFMRRTSLDELPQLFNVLMGDMSLVGPRPELPWLVERYEPWQRKRFAVPQGITGWWQVNGRSDKPMHLSTEDDLYYIQNYSILLDIIILWKTLTAVLKRRGAF